MMLPVLSNGTPKTHGNLTFQSKRSLLKKIWKTTQLQMAIWWKPIWWWLVICICSVCKYKYFSITYVNVNRFMSFSTHNHGSSVHISGMVIVSVLITETWQKHAPYLAVSPWNFPHCLQGSSLPRRTLVAELRVSHMRCLKDSNLAMENHRIFPTLQGGTHKLLYLSLSNHHKPNSSPI